MPTRLVDLSHTIRDGLTTYPGLPAPAIRPFLARDESRQRYAEGTEFEIASIEMVANTGTYVDAPYHRYSAGADVAALPLDSLADLEGIVVRVRSRETRAIGVEMLEHLDLTGRAVLIETGWSEHWGSETYLDGHPYLTRSAAELLVDRRAALVGIDSLNIDDTSSGERPVHSILLAARIPIVEHLTSLDQLPDGRFRFFAVPPRFERVGSFPVRAFAIIEE